MDSAESRIHAKNSCQLYMFRLTLSVISERARQWIGKSFETISYRLAIADLAIPDRQIVKPAQGA